MLKYLKASSCDLRALTAVKRLAFEPPIARTRRPNGVIARTGERYRSDIDLLRGIAVLLVVAFHWKLGYFSGGYVGVDIFFVISGFLITRMIYSETLTGTFSFLAFYERRIRRLMPALYVLVAVTAIVCLFCLLPPDYSNFSRSIVAVVTFTSNILFWRESGYFDAPTSEKPLLHTWSLSVEEQFYLVFPLAIYLLVRYARRWEAVCIAAAAAVSFAISVYAVHSHPSVAFYFAPSRAWEFLVGSFLAVDGVRPQKRRSVQRTAATLGLALAFFSSAVFTEKTPFPGVYAVVPVLGTAFFIWAYSGGLKELRAPPARVLIFFGKISYSLYLWHWPIIVLARPFAEDRDLSPTELGCLIIAAVGVSYLSYRYLEQPVRKRALFTTRRNLFAAAAVASVLLLALGIAGVISAGFPQRLDPRITTVAEYANYNIRQLYRLGDCFLTDEQRFSDLKRAICAQREPDKKNVLIWGDSFAAHHFFGLQQLGMQNNIHFLQANKSSCAPLFDVDTSVPNCREFNDGVRSLMESERLDGVIVSAAWRAYVDQIGPDIFFVELHNTMARMLKSGASVFIFGPPIEYKKSLPQLLSRFAITGLEKFDSAKYLNPENFPLDDRMAREFTPIYGLQYLSILETICKEGRSCPFLIQNSVPMQWDNVHLTAPASLFMASELFPAILAHLTKK